MVKINRTTNIIVIIINKQLVKQSIKVNFGLSKLIDSRFLRIQNEKKLLIQKT